MPPANFHLPLAVAIALALLFCAGSDGNSQQIPIPRVEAMPNMPAPYHMRDWKHVAQGYDSLVFDLGRTGEYLPLVWINPNPINYPEHQAFGLHSYVGTFSPGNGEAINVLPAVIGATLVGIDKSGQHGMNWVLMCEEFFNRRPQENVYLNGPISSSGNDWWYDTMPNIFFYQLYDLYPGTGDFANQFRKVAERWLAAVRAMGGSATPWTRPYMNYRAWRLATMTPNTSGVREPEAAGAIAWILYHAYVETGEVAFRIGAEWAMEFLNARTANPSYELQLPYGAYAAARMNAELGTNYNVEKILNWCFDIGPLRRWGVIVGNWGGYDCAGLVGEAQGEGDYAFAMNGFEQVGALVPLVRYDDRFARAIGKWVLNVANASRLFYSKFLPGENQDNEDWAVQNDPGAYIAYEALRREWFGHSPYATGDAIRGQWAATNLGLYGSSHVGILGGIIDTTNVPMILQLDVRKTDYFSDLGYPTYLFFNPYPETKTVTFDPGPGVHDIYDAVRNTFLLSGAGGPVHLDLPADAAVLAVVVPAGGTVTYVLGRMLVNGIVADYRAGRPVANYPPRIKALAAAVDTALQGQAVAVYCTAVDRELHHLVYQWQASGGSLSGAGPQITWTAPAAGGYVVSCRIDDGHGGADSADIRIEVLANAAPQITALRAAREIVDPGDTTQVFCMARDPEGDSLQYVWTAAAGDLAPSGATAVWTAPQTPGYYEIICHVQDGAGGEAIDSVGITAGGLVAFYPFNGDAADASGFENNGTVFGPQPVPDRFANPGSAFFFDGVDDFVRVPLHPSLNFQDAISLNFWLQVAQFFPREAFPISHGSWQNRWKVSIIPEKRLRWTLKTTSGIVDLDSQARLVADSLYNVTVTYGGGKARIYLNGVLNAEKAWSGKILQTEHDVTIGQMLPGNNQYNFRGILDDVRIYNHVLSQAEIQALYDVATGAGTHASAVLPATTVLHPNYPNPFNPGTTLRYDLAQESFVLIEIYNPLGQKVRTLLSRREAAGAGSVEWDGRNDADEALPSGVYLVKFIAGKAVQTRKLMLLR